MLHCLLFALGQVHTHLLQEETAQLTVQGSLSTQPSQAAGPLLCPLCQLQPGIPCSVPLASPSTPVAPFQCCYWESGHRCWAWTSFSMATRKWLFPIPTILWHPRYSLLVIRPDGRHVAQSKGKTEYWHVVGSRAGSGPIPTPDTCPSYCMVSVGGLEDKVGAGPLQC